MQKVKIGLIQGGFRSAFNEKIPELRKHNEYCDMLGHDDFQYNSAFLINSEGSIVHKYRKTHETDDVLKRMPYELGNELSVVDTPWGKTGILICHDRWYPENHRTLRMKGAELILNPAASTTFWPGHQYFSIHRSTLQSHAYANGLFHASCNSLNHGGHSVVIAPDGSIIGEADMNMDIFICNIDPSDYESYDFISNLKPSLYRF